MKYYNTRQILKKNATYNIIFGERSNGKTYSVQLSFINDYFKNKNHFVILRRWSEDIKGKRAKGIFTEINANKEILKITNNEYSLIHYYASRFYFANTCAKSKKIIFDINKPIGYSLSLTESEHNKSLSFPHVSNILFDEFLTNKIYLPEEFILFMNTISTIIRNRENVKIFMLGNTVNKYCPYFTEMGLNNILKMKQGDIDIYKYGDSSLTVAVEYCTSLKKFKKNNHYFAFDNPKLNMITSGAWELSIYPHLPLKYEKKDIQLTFFIDFNDLIYHCDCIQLINDMFIYIHLKTTEIKKANDIVYSLKHNTNMFYNMNIYKPQSKVQTRILWFFTTNRVYYQDNTIGDSISNYLKICANR